MTISVGDSGFDVAVVGGGIIGLSVALTLQSEGKRVCLMEAGDVGRGASWGNAGHLATEQIDPIADVGVLKKLPKMLLDPLGPLRLDWRYLPQLTPWMIRLLLNLRPKAFANTCAALIALNSHSLPAWLRLVQRWDLGAYVHTHGSYLVCEQAASVATVQAHGARLQQRGVDNEWVDQAPLLAALPALASNQLGGLFFPETGHVTDLPAILARLTAAFTGLGGTVMTCCEVVDARQGPEGVVLKSKQDHVVQAAEVVVACGAYSKPLVKQLLNLSVPLDTERGYHLMLPQAQGLLPVPVSSADRRFIMTPMDAGLRLAGTVEFAGLDAAPNMARAQNLHALAQPMLRAPLDLADSSDWMGFRPSFPDSLPVIDRVGRVTLAFGHQHLGLTQAALTAELVSQLMHDRTPTIPLTPFRINRF
ncbi:MAG: FAD-binding oxidoreductase [Neisseriaceae bacterium]|nr:FAD-binding oxidoreductase [Neisseriaceae bacterium]